MHRLTQGKLLYCASTAARRCVQCDGGWFACNRNGDPWCHAWATNPALLVAAGFTLANRTSYVTGHCFTAALG
jgi:hypothetical protein